jgi:hypothetical protein
MSGPFMASGKEILINLKQTILTLKFLFYLAGQMKRERKDLSFVTDLGSLILIGSALFVLNCSKFGPTFTGTTPTILCGNTSGRSTAPVLPLIPNLVQRNSISIREFNGLVGKLLKRNQG